MIGMETDKDALTVGDLLDGMKQGDLVTAKPHTTLYACMKKLNDFDISAIVVNDEQGEFAGIATERDFTRKGYYAGLDEKSTPVKKIMTPASEVVYVTEDNTIVEVEEIAKKVNKRHIPILKGKKAIGIISIRNLRDIDKIVETIGVLREDELKEQQSIIFG